MKTIENFYEKQADYYEKKADRLFEEKLLCREEIAKLHYALSQYMRIKEPNRDLLKEMGWGIIINPLIEKNIRELKKTISKD